MSTGYGRPNGIAMTMSEDKETIPYRKKLNKITGKVTATILLQQAMYWDIKKDGKFFKFIAPCTHDWYKEGDSWLEELGFSRSEFNTAIKKIGYKRGKNKNKIENEEDAYVIYYTDSDRVTYWFINWEKLNYDLLKVYHPDLIGKSTITKSKGNDELLRDKEKQDYPITESTTETTNRDNNGHHQSAKVQPIIYAKTIADDECYSAIKYYNHRYYMINDKFLALKVNQWQQVKDKFEKVMDEQGLTVDDMKLVIDKYFDTVTSNDYNILHFISGDIIKNQLASLGLAHYSEVE